MFEVRNEAESCEILLYDYVGEHTDFWTGEKTGVSAKAFKAALDECGGKPVSLRIDSSGGDVFEAFAMCSAIQRYPGEVTAYIDGLAASAASYIAVVCSSVVMNDYAYLMIHCASSYASGNARDMEDVAARLRNIDANLAAIYEKRSALTLDEVLDYMADETWFTAQEALDCGLATEVVETQERMAACIDAFAAKNYRHVPEALNIKAEQVQSHAPRTIEADAVEKAAYAILDGKIYRKEGQNEQ